MPKEKLERVKLENIKFTDEILKNSSNKKGVDIILGKGPKIDVWLSTIPYREFKVVLLHPIVKKENFDYRMSKYGWWMFCAKKEKLDKTDEELSKFSRKYGMYKENGHTFCNDNMSRGKEMYNLHPNDMVKNVKKGIDKFYQDKDEMLKNGKRKIKKRK